MMSATEHNDLMERPFRQEEIDAVLKMYDDSSDHIIKKQPTVSVIIPVYNCERYIPLAIESVRMQSWKSLELIIVDDGSDDGTTELLQKIIDPRVPEVQVIYQLQNKGTASALNEGIKHARGEWIKWLSADDMMYPNCIQDMMIFGVEDNAKQSKNAIFYSDYDIIDERGSLIGDFIEPDRNQQDHETRTKELFSHFYGNGSTSLIHKNVFKRCGFFDESLKHSEDYEFWLRATALFNISMIRVPTKTIKYRRWSGQLTNRVGGSLDEQIKNSIKEKMAKLTV